jgi:hypothetical protein
VGCVVRGGWWRLVRGRAPTGWKKRGRPGRTRIVCDGEREARTSPRHDATRIKNGTDLENVT